MAPKPRRVSRGPHLSTLVASSIAREIAKGRLKPGDQLPTEQALATTFAVSRNVVREAIARLRSEGRVWSQQGRGAFVAEAAPVRTLTINPADLHTEEAFGGLFELRAILEGAAAALAAERRSDDDLAALRAAYAGMRDIPYGSARWLGADLAFHRAVAAATGNGHIVGVLALVSERVRDSILASGHQQGSEAMAELTLDEHRRVLDAVADRDPIAALEAMRAHLAAAAARVGLPAPAAPPHHAQHQLAAGSGKA